MPPPDYEAGTRIRKCHQLYSRILNQGLRARKEDETK